MFGLSTILIDKYREKEAEEIAEAIGALCPTTPTFSWASSGVYAYWNPYDHQILYIGLTHNHRTRFEQHNGIEPCDAGSCKKEQIGAHFREYDLLGVSLIVQSSNVQPDPGQNRVKKASRNEVELNFLKYFGKESSIMTEGFFLGLMTRLGQKPLWNGPKGDRRGQKLAESADLGDYPQFLNVTDKKKSFFRSEHTIRELATNNDLLIAEMELSGKRATPGAGERE